MASDVKPWACIGYGALPCPDSFLGLVAGRGRPPKRCPACIKRQDTWRGQEKRRVTKAAAETTRLIDEIASAPVDPEPSKVTAYPEYDPGKVLNQYGRRGKLPLELPAGYCPDPAVDLPGARVWVMRHHFGVEPYSWQVGELRALGDIPRPRQAYVQLGRKNGKTMFGCELILTELVLVPASAIYAVSDSERNLQSAMVGDLKRLIARSPTAAGAFVTTTGRIEYPHNGSFFEVRPNKFAATQSINPTMVVVDEVHLQKTGEVWDGFLLSDPGGVNFLLVGITTPGYDLTSHAHSLYLRVKAGDPTIYGRIFEPDDLECALDDVTAWQQSNPRLEDDPAFMEVIRGQLESGMPEHEFRRFRLGIWTATASAWLPYGVWDARAVTGRQLTPLDIGPGDEVWLGFDGSFSGDSTALVAARGTHVSVAGAWENPGRKGWRVPRADVEATITQWMEAGRRVKLLVDPPYWTREISEWQQRWPGRVLEFPTHVRARMAPACTAFYAAILDGTLTHDGDKRLTRHVSNAIVKSSPQGDYITKPDPGSPAKIDLAVAAVVAFSAASAATRRRSPVGVF